MVRIFGRILLVLVILLLAGVAYIFWPRQGDLRGFDADAVARLETAMWRDYYTHNYKGLTSRLYALYRDEYHFSPADSLQLAYAAAKAAQLFQPTTSRAEAQAALPLLVRYFTLLRDHSGEAFDPDKAARLELDWWQLRRENAEPTQYGAVIAQVTEELFHVHNPSIEKSALQRAMMMRYRDDRRSSGMQPDDWTHIEKNLIEAYRELKVGVARTP
jgi:hypothetical protein